MRRTRTKIQNLKDLKRIKVVGSCLNKINFAEPVTIQIFRPILPKLPVDPSVDRRQFSSNVEQGNS